MARKKKGRPVNGILVLDKPAGMTSNSALQKVKKLFQAQKAGHTGSLDPLATGVLPICLGEATKVSHFLLDADKCYRARCILGSVTTTGDSDGEIIANHPVPQLSEQQLLNLLASFQGDQEQTPPMYSALKYNGRPLYEYARKGIEIERKARHINIFNIKLLNYSFDTDDSFNTDGSGKAFIDIEVHCSKGTYIRTLCEDIGQTIGCGAHISALRRLESGPFLLSQSVSLPALTEKFGPYDELDDIDKNRMNNLLLPTDTAINELPAVTLDDEQYERIQHGHAIVHKPNSHLYAIHPQQSHSQNNHQSSAADSASGSEHYRLYHNNTLIALAILDESGYLKPKRLLFL